MGEVIKNSLVLGQNSQFSEKARLELQDVLQAFQSAAKKVSPLWDIRDYVAVNPFFGFRDRKFYEFLRYLKRVSGRSLVPRKKFFLKKFQAGEITTEDLVWALQAEASRPSLGSITQADLEMYLHLPEKELSSRSIHSVSDWVDQENASDWSSRITEEVSKWASAYFDETQSLWKAPARELRFFSWWKSLAVLDRGFGNSRDRWRQLVQDLPEQPELALQFLSQKLLSRSFLSTRNLSDYFYRLLYSVLGWSSFFQRFEFEAQRTGDAASSQNKKLQQVGGLIDLLAVRMVYDLLFLEETSDLCSASMDPDPTRDKDLRMSHIWLLATEHAYRRSLMARMFSVGKPAQAFQQQEKSFEVQMVFCIDVRSEVLRRHLEMASPQIQTLGFAGFFGLPVSFKGLGHRESDQNCPVLLNSAFEVSEKAPSESEKLSHKKVRYVETQYMKRHLQSSANSGFAFVETLGLSYIGKMLAAGLGLRKPNLDTVSMGLSELDRDQICLDISNLDFESRISFAFGALKNMGLTKNFARFIFFLGHGSESANNPYAGALDCGACAGHNGLSNARLLAQLLNDPQVRQGLIQKGIEIPTQSIFLSGWHHTTKDELRLDPIQNQDLSEEQGPKKYLPLFEQALKACRKERAERLSNASSLDADPLYKHLHRRAQDWSEIRPEWGLARNASFVVGRRSLTRGLDLQGRSFLHDYNPAEDPDLSKLELIMTAPMIVTNWINMQYFASTLDPQKFGAGNKVLTNVVGGVGCVQGNGSDLLGGLTEQSVWYKGEYFHEPLRLQVFIEASTSSLDQIIAKHGMVKDLLMNDWLQLIAIDADSQKFYLFQNGHWTEITPRLWH